MSAGGAAWRRKDELDPNPAVATPFPLPLLLSAGLGLALGFPKDGARPDKYPGYVVIVPVCSGGGREQKLTENPSIPPKV